MTTTKNSREKGRGLLEFVIKNQGSDQIQVLLNPKDSHYSFDCVRLKLVNQQGEKQIVDMTPDEAMEICGLLSAACSVWLLQNPAYNKFIGREKKSHGKKTL